MYLPTAESGRFQGSVQPEDTRLGGLSVQERQLVDAVVSRELSTITADDVERLLEIGRPAANDVLRRLAHKGWLHRVQRGLYAPVPLGARTRRAPIEDPWLIAMALYSPGYISGWSAAEHWGLTEQIFNAVSVVTAVPQRARNQQHGGIAFYVRSVDASAIFGTKKIWIRSSRATVADPSRLVVDILQTPELGGGIRHALDVVRNYWRSEHADPRRVLEYAEQLGRGAVFKRLGYTAEIFASPTARWTARCRPGMSAGVSRLDPSGSNRGQIVSRWRLRLNAPVGDA